MVHPLHSEYRCSLRKLTAAPKFWTQPKGDSGSSSGGLHVCLDHVCVVLRTTPTGNTEWVHVNLVHRNRASGKRFRSLNHLDRNLEGCWFPGQEGGRGGGGRRRRAVGWTLWLRREAPSHRWTGPGLHMLTEHYTSLSLSRPLSPHSSALLGPARAHRRPERNINHPNSICRGEAGATSWMSGVDTSV